MLLCFVITAPNYTAAGLLVHGQPSSRWTSIAPGVLGTRLTEGTFSWQDSGSRRPGLCSLAQLRDTLHWTHGFSSSLRPTLHWVSSLLFPVFCCSASPSCPALCTSMDCSRPDSSAHGVSRLEDWSGLPCPFPPFSYETPNKMSILSHTI